MIETALGTIDIGNLIAIIGYIIGLIVGYVKLSEKTKQNELLIEIIKMGCDKCKLKNMLTIEKIDQRIDAKFDKLVKLINDVKALVTHIATELAKLTGIILTYMKSMTDRRQGL